MKTIIILSLVLAISVSENINASQCDKNLEAALAPTTETENVQSQLLYLFDTGLVTSIGVGRCDAQTGLESESDRDSVDCIVILALDEAAKTQLLGVFPPQTKISGVIVLIKKGGGPVNALGYYSPD